MKLLTGRTGASRAEVKWNIKRAANPYGNRYFYSLILSNEAINYTEKNSAVQSDSLRAINSIEQ